MTSDSLAGLLSLVWVVAMDEGRVAAEEALGLYF
ncbi:MAG: hypothetical protein RL397_1942 [Pseudomonadota bacterium]|jgi:hypothetical protein